MYIERRVELLKLCDPLSWIILLLVTLAVLDCAFGAISRVRTDDLSVMRPIAIADLPHPSRPQPGQESVNATDATYSFCAPGNQSYQTTSPVTLRPQGLLDTPLDACP